MSVTDHGHEHTGYFEGGGGYHDTPQEKHRKEHVAVWLFIFGDAVFFMLELFFWFYLRANNTAGMWRGANCTAQSPQSIAGAGPTATNICTDGLGNPITHEIATAAPLHTLAIAALIIIAAAFVWFAEVQARQGGTRKGVTPLLGLGVIFVVAAIVWQIVQFQILPFTTIQGTYASTFEFYMGSNIAHFLLALTVGFGLFNRSRIGKYEDGRWFQVHLSRIFFVWVAFSSAVLALVTVLFA
jgi:heme/copper-type cytochrome/quinol oxidase subunit 3